VQLVQHRRARREVERDVVSYTAVRRQGNLHGPPDALDLKISGLDLERRRTVHEVVGLQVPAVEDAGQVIDVSKVRDEVGTAHPEAPSGSRGRGHVKCSTVARCIVRTGKPVAVRHSGPRRSPGPDASGTSLFHGRSTRPGELAAYPRRCRGDSSRRRSPSRVRVPERTRAGSLPRARRGQTDRCPQR
jgi:hypothetical protein